MKSGRVAVPISQIGNLKAEKVTPRSRKVLGYVMPSEVPVHPLFGLPKFLFGSDPKQLAQEPTDRAGTWAQVTG